MASSYTLAETYGASSGGDNAYCNLLATNVTSGADAAATPPARKLHLDHVRTQVAQNHAGATWPEVEQVSAFKRATQRSSGMFSPTWQRVPPALS